MSGEPGSDKVARVQRWADRLERSREFLDERLDDLREPGVQQPLELGKPTQVELIGHARARAVARLDAGPGHPDRI